MVLVGSARPEAVETGNQLSSDHFERAVDYFELVLQEIETFPDFRIAGLDSDFGDPYFIESDQRKAIFFMSLMLITAGSSIRDRLLRVKGILAGKCVL